MSRRVVITGMGAVTPLGHSVEEVWERLLKCESGIGKTTLFDASTFPTQFAAEVHDFDFTACLSPEAVVDQKDAARNSQFMIGAAMQAWKQAALPEKLIDCVSGGKCCNALCDGDAFVPKSDRVGVYLGAGEGPPDFDNSIAPTVAAWIKDENDVDWGIWSKVAFERMDATVELEQEPNIPSARVARLFGLRGPIMSCLTACAASTQAIGEATDLIRANDADIVIAGGTHSMIHPLGTTGFNRLTALSIRNDDYKTSSRPFDQTRDGFVLAEGAGALILEELECAKRRGAKILAEVIGYGSTGDAFRVTDQHEDGRGGARLDIDKIDYISAHGTGTHENDSIETHVIKSVFGDRAYKIPISSVKSMLGHLIAAAGSIEMITCVLAIRDNIVPPTTNLHTPDPQCDLDYVPNEPRKVNVNIAMSNSFGFGGQNNTIIIRQFNG